MKLKPICHALAAGVLLCPLLAQASMFYDGADLKHLLDINARVAQGNASALEAAKAGRLQGFIVGVNDALSGSEFCPPKEAKLGDLIAVVGEYVDLNIDRWDEPAVVLAAEALAAEYPCKGKKRTGN